MGRWCFLAFPVRILTVAGQLDSVSETLASGRDPNRSLPPNLDSIGGVGNSEKQHIPGAHLLSTLGGEHRKPSPARMEDSQQQGAAIFQENEGLDALFPPVPYPLTYTHLPTPQGKEERGEEEPLGSCSSPACYLSECSGNICTELCRAPLKFLALVLP